MLWTTGNAELEDTLRWGPVHPLELDILLVSMSEVLREYAVGLLVVIWPTGREVALAAMLSTSLRNESSARKLSSSKSSDMSISRRGEPRI